MTSHSDMHPYTEAALLETIEAKNSKMCYTQADELPYSSKRLNEELKITFHSSYEDKVLQELLEEAFSVWNSSEPGRKGYLQELGGIKFVPWATTQLQNIMQPTGIKISNI